MQIQDKNLKNTLHFIKFGLGKYGGAKEFTRQQVEGVYWSTVRDIYRGNQTGKPSIDDIVALLKQDGFTIDGFDKAQLVPDNGSHNQPSAVPNGKSNNTSSAEAPAQDEKFALDDFRAIADDEETLELVARLELILPHVDSEGNLIAEERGEVLQAFVRNKLSYTNLTIENDLLCFKILHFGLNGDASQLQEAKSALAAGKHCAILLKKAKEGYGVDKLSQLGLKPFEKEASDLAGSLSIGGEGNVPVADTPNQNPPEANSPPDVQATEGSQPPLPESEAVVTVLELNSGDGQEIPDITPKRSTHKGGAHSLPFEEILERAGVIYPHLQENLSFNWGDAGKACKALKDKKMPSSPPAPYSIVRELKANGINTRSELVVALEKEGMPVVKAEAPKSSGNEAKTVSAAALLDEMILYFKDQELLMRSLAERTQSFIEKLEAMKTSASK
jgi:hypothetical protein